MTGLARLRIQVEKEIRALAPAWAACAVALVAVRLSGPGFARGFMVPAYMAGAAAVGALSMGHEYNHRTLGLLLSQPVPRVRALLVKLSVLTATLLTLGAFASALGIPSTGWARQYGLVFAWVPLLWAVCVAPWLTLLCRSAIAGAVFTMPLPILLMLAGDLAGSLLYGHVADVDRLKIAVAWRGTAGLCALGAVGTWLMFTRLEAIDGAGPDVRLPDWLRWPAASSAASSTITKRHPLWLLVKKELHLQRMAMAVSVVASLWWPAFFWARPTTHESGDVFTAMTVFCGALVAMLVGSLASAEERQLGTLEWQVLLPMAMTAQWAVKVATVLVLAIVLALGVPALLAFSHLVPDMHQLLRPGFALVIVLVTAVSLFVSSLCSSGLRALVWSLPVVLAGAVALDRVNRLAAINRVDVGLMTAPGLLVAAAFVAAALWFGLKNHRSAERSAR